MSSVTAISNQTIYDVCLQAYGTVEALAEVLALNPDLSNDDRAKVAAGVDPIADTSFYLDLAVKPGIAIRINPDSPLMRGNTLRELAEPITTFNL